MFLGIGINNKWTNCSYYHRRLKDEFHIVTYLTKYSGRKRKNPHAFYSFRNWRIQTIIVNRVF